MNKNTTRPALILTFAVAILACMRFLPETAILGYEVKKVDLFSDIMPSDTASLKVENLNLIPEDVKVKEFACPEGVTCIEDFSDDSPSGMSSFYRALSQRDSIGRPVRIAYFGDSFTEADILTADLRSLLQQEFGGCGVGYLSVAPEAPGFRKSVIQRHSGWQNHQCIDSIGFVRRHQSIAQTYAHPFGTSTVSIRGTDKYAQASHFETSTFYVISRRPVTFYITANDTTRHTLSSKGTGRLESLTVSGDMSSVRWTASTADTTVIGHGVAVEGSKGITLDNFSMRATSGMQLAAIDTAYLKTLAKQRPYDLIMLHYGLNVAGKNQTNYDGYVKNMTAVIERFKACFPNTSILIVGVSDRENRINGELHTMPGVLALMQYQQQMAALNKVAFWNLYKAMGGDGSIVKLSEKKPAEARKDYTHITFEGGKTLADYYFKALMAGYQQYNIMNQ